MMKFASFSALLILLASCLTSCSPGAPRNVPDETPTTTADTLRQEKALGLLESGTKQNIYSLRFVLSELNCRMTVNGLRVLETINGEPKTSAITSLNGLIMPGANTLEILLDTTLNKGFKFPKKATFDLFPFVASPQSEDSLAIWTYSYKDSPQQPSFPAKLTFTFEVDDLPPSLFWKEAEELALDEATKEEIKQVILDIHTAIARKDTAAFFSLFDYQIDEVIRYYYHNDLFKENWKQNIHTRLQSINLQPLDPSQYDYHLLAGGKIIYVEADGQSPVRTLTGRGKIPILLGKVDGKIRLVR